MIVVIMKNGDRMIKSLKQGELLFLASYMVDPVRLDWSKVARLESKDSHLISMADGYQFTEQFQVEDSGTDNFHSSLGLQTLRGESCIVVLKLRRGQGPLPNLRG